MVNTLISMELATSEHFFSNHINLYHLIYDPRDFSLNLSVGN